ncbi:MAG: AMP-binding protein [Mariprofundaceae bacterium]|nr:AMP-binding protein [Mariprofundaceae bacterium]
MSLTLDAVAKHGLEQADAVAIQGHTRAVTYAQLANYITNVNDYILSQEPMRVAILMDNTPAILIVDLGCIQAKIPVVPLPLFFSPQQVKHALQSSGSTLLVSNLGESVEGLLKLAGVAYDALPGWRVAGESLQVYRLQVEQEVHFPESVQKITYTSGSTGDAKGVCLRQSVMDEVAVSLAQATEACADDRHLCLLPYATLLENIAGMYVPLIAGATVCLPGLAQVGMQGSSGLDVSRFMTCLHESGATSCVMIPQMLQALLGAVVSGMPKPNALRFIAVGGAPVSKHLLAQAEALGLPVYEGYGLSEASSVVTLNTPAAKKQGSVGRVLPHVALRIADDGEIILQGELFSGYLGDSSSQVDEWATGDIGRLDDEGFLYIEGRKKHIFITSFGRNVSPEWVEKEFNIESAIAQSCVFGEAKPFNVAVVALRGGFDASSLAAAFESANQRLPDYAQVHHWIIANEPFSIENGQWTGTGRPRRMVIKGCYQQALVDIYEEET